MFIKLGIGKGSIRVVREYNDILEAVRSVKSKAGGYF